MQPKALVDLREPGQGNCRSHLGFKELVTLTATSKLLRTFAYRVVDFEGEAALCQSPSDNVSKKEVECTVAECGARGQWSSRAMAHAMLYQTRSNTKAGGRGSAGTWKWLPTFREVDPLNCALPFVAAHGCSFHVSGLNYT